MATGHEAVVFIVLWSYQMELLLKARLTNGSAADAA